MSMTLDRARAAADKAYNDALAAALQEYTAADKARAATHKAYLAALAEARKAHREARAAIANADKAEEVLTGGQMNNSNEDQIARDGDQMRGDEPYRGDRLSRVRDELFEIFKEINKMPRIPGRHDENRAWDMSQLWAAYRAIDDCDTFGGYYPRGK